MKLEDLTDLERRFVETVAAGQPFVIAQEVPPDEDCDTHDVRATVIEALIDGKFGAPRVTRHGLVMAGARITGALNLRNITFPYRLWMAHCLFIDSILLGQATIGELSLENATLTSELRAPDIEIEGDFVLRGARATGLVDLNSARIGGQLTCTGAVLDGGGGPAFMAQGLTSQDDAFLSGVTATGLVDLSGARIGGQLDCANAVLNGGDGAAFRGQQLTTKESVFLLGVTATGLVELNAARIGGQLSCKGAVLDGGDGPALNGQGLTTQDSTFLRDVTATGRVDLAGARIGGQLDCAGAVLNGGDGPAFNGQGLTTQASVFLRGVTATGLVDLSMARIGGQLDCRGAVLNGKGGKCLNLQEATLFALLLTLSPESAGLIDLTKAEIGALLVGHDGWPRDVEVSARDVRVASLPDYATAEQGKWLSWLKKSVLWSPHLYQQIALRLKEAGHEDCAKAFYIAMRRRMRREERGSLNWFKRSMDRLLDVAVGYGHRPMRALCWMAGLVMLGTVFFYAAESCLAIAPNKPVVMLDLERAYGAEGYRQCAYRYPDRSSSWFDVRTETEINCLPPDYPAFIPLLYSLDLAIPLLEMRPEQYWSINGSAPGGWLFTLYYYFHLTMGIVLTGLFLAAVTGLVKKE